jgi:lysozyme family protein
MEVNWQYCLKAIRLEEGGNDDDPRDPGGRTSRGIIQREYNAYRKRKKLPIRDVWKAVDSEIDEIYYISYWQPWSPKWPGGIDLVYFDMCVNAGPVQATKILQRCLRVKDDGHIGIVTLTAIESLDEKAIVAFIKGYSLRRLTFYRSLRHAKTYIKGWTKRTNRIEAKAIKLATPDLEHTLRSRISDDSQSV